MSVDGDGANGRVVPLTRAPYLKLTDERRDGRHTLTLTGELDMASAPVLDASLRRIGLDGPDTLVLDLSSLTFLDSTGLRAILRARDLCKRHRCQLLLIPGPAKIQRLFEVTGLLDRLPFQAHAAEA